VSATFLTDPWFAELDAAVAEEPRYAGPPLTVEVTVVGGPGDPVTYHVDLVDGSGPRYGVGPAAGTADASYDLAWADAVGQLQGSYDPAVGFMTGTLKVKGSSRPLFELFRLWASPAHVDAVAKLAAATDVPA
jgi:hypothetical protein